MSDDGRLPWQMLPPTSIEQYGLPLDPQENALAAARYLAARYGPPWTPWLLSPDYVIALERIRWRHAKIGTRVSMYARLADALGEPPSRFLTDMVDIMADEIAGIDELLFALGGDS